MRAAEAVLGRCSNVREAWDDRLRWDPWSDHSGTRVPGCCPLGLCPAIQNDGRWTVGPMSAQGRCRLAENRPIILRLVPEALVLFCSPEDPQKENRPIIPRLGLERKVLFCSGDGPCAQSCGGFPRDGGRWLLACRLCRPKDRWMGEGCRPCRLNLWFLGEGRGIRDEKRQF